MSIKFADSFNILHLHKEFEIPILALTTRNSVRFSDNLKGRRYIIHSFTHKSLLLKEKEKKSELIPWKN